MQRLSPHESEYVREVALLGELSGTATDGVACAGAGLAPNRDREAGPSSLGPCHHLSHTISIGGPVDHETGPRTTEQPGPKPLNIGDRARSTVGDRARSTVEPIGCGGRALRYRATAYAGHRVEAIWTDDLGTRRVRFYLVRPGSLWERVAWLT